jgi:nucleoside-diphosphate-sugar epimerase
LASHSILEAARKLKITNVVLASSETLIGIPLLEHPTKLPITEETTRAPHSAYSLGKLMGEHLADQYAVWCPESKYMSLRFSNVMLESEYAGFEDWQKDPALRYWNCWGYIDARDGASAIHAALVKKTTGHHQYLVANNNTCMRMPNTDLIKATFPNTPYEPVNKDDPNESLLCIAKATRELGWTPKHDWK